MAKQKRKLIENLLFEVYDKGLQQNDCNLTDYYEKIQQALHKHGVMPSLFAVSTEEGINELFWSKKKAEEKFAIYVKEFPSTLFWVEEVFPS